MKSLAVVIGLPFLTIVIVSLFAMGGLGRIASLTLLAICVVGAVAGLFWKRNPNPDH
jgi:hypothetical protein